MLSVVHSLLVVRPTLPMQWNWEHCLTETWLQTGTGKHNLVTVCVCVCVCVIEAYYS